MGRTVLDEIAERTAVRVGQLKKKRDLACVRREAEWLGKRAGERFPFWEALAAPDLSFICEVKKASPSKGVIAEEFPYLAIAKEYEAAGASAVSVLTEPYYFLGSDAYLEEIAEAVSVPLLRKDFTVDAYQIYEARLIGASAVLLIAALLKGEQMKEYLAIARSLGLSALVEVHTEAEVETALQSGADIIGVNNRNLHTFEVDIRTSVRLRKRVPDGILFVAESGIRTPEDVAVLREQKADAVLVGETFMKNADKKRQMEILRGGENHEKPVTAGKERTAARAGGERMGGRCCDENQNMRADA